MAVAKECGWKKKPSSGEGWGAVPKGYPDSKIWWYAHQLPHYESDLNAMHEASLSVEYSKWSNALMRVIQDQECCGAVEARYKTAKATALQCAEAFLRVRNLWVDK